eukprot:comp21780_c0_seq1/m.30928 comp21780_c0_seq1/g.30928  ORF comp21780_c0_seq1/g.30928 comp21780_c0_seq1/m.30928 type:complete len:832 (-) comp21780_c0_seq1:313-2808(-)
MSHFGNMAGLGPHFWALLLLVGAGQVAAQLPTCNNPYDYPPSPRSFNYAFPTDVYCSPNNVQCIDVFTSTQNATVCVPVSWTKRTALPDQTSAACTNPIYQLVNGGFEMPINTAASNTYSPTTGVSGWQSNGTCMRLYSTPKGDATPAVGGAQFLETMCNDYTAVYQDIKVVPGDQYILQFYHRAFQSTSQTVSVQFGDPAVGASSLVEYMRATSNSTAWTKNKLIYDVPSNQTSVRLWFLPLAGDLVNQSTTVGNRLDNVTFTPTRCQGANVNECALNMHNCHTSATCLDTLGSFVCVCNSGFAGNGIMCGDPAFATCFLPEYRLQNGDFEIPKINYKWYEIMPANLVPDWKTTESSIEFWRTGMSGFTAPSGVQFIEISALAAGSTVYQDFNVVGGDTLTFKFKHIGRSGTDTVGVMVGPANPTFDYNNMTQIASFSTSNTTWGSYSVIYTVPQKAKRLRLGFKSLVSACSGGCGNIIDALEFTSARCQADVNECTLATHKCHASATCTNTPGSYTCRCNSGFIGDGTICTANMTRVCEFNNYYLVNGDFETPEIGKPGTYNTFLKTLVPGWRSTEANLEFWTSGLEGVPAISGSQFAEIQANERSMLYQDFDVIPLSLVAMEFSHRGRFGNDTVSVLMGPPTNLTEIARVTTDNKAWKVYKFGYRVPAGVASVRLAFNAISSAFNYVAAGNLVDNIAVSNAQCFPPVNECALGTHLCDPSAQCTDTPTLYNCTCNSGYSGDGTTCTKDQPMVKLGDWGITCAPSQLISQSTVSDSTACQSNCRAHAQCRYAAYDRTTRNCSLFNSCVNVVQGTSSTVELYSLGVAAVR